MRSMFISPDEKWSWGYFADTPSSVQDCYIWRFLDDGDACPVEVPPQIHEGYGEKVYGLVNRYRRMKTCNKIQWTFYYIQLEYEKKEKRYLIFHLNVCTGSQNYCACNNIAVLDVEIWKDSAFAQTFEKSMLWKTRCTWTIREETCTRDKNNLRRTSRKSCQRTLLSKTELRVTFLTYSVAKRAGRDESGCLRAPWLTVSVLWIVRDVKLGFVLLLWSRYDKKMGKRLKMRRIPGESQLKL